MTDIEILCADFNFAMSSLPKDFQTEVHELLSVIVSMCDPDPSIWIPATERMLIAAHGIRKIRSN